MNSSPPKWCWSHGNHGLEATVMVTAVDWLLDEWSDEENQEVDRFFFPYVLHALNSSVPPIIIHSLLKIQAMQTFLKSYSGIGGSVACILCWKMNCFSREGKLHMQEKLVTNRAFAWKLEDLVDWERSKIGSVRKSRGGKESERSNRLTDSVMRCCLEKRHPVSCCSNHFTTSQSSLDLVEIVLGPVFSTQNPSYDLCVTHKLFFKCFKCLEAQIPAAMKMTSDTETYFKSSGI